MSTMTAADVAAHEASSHVRVLKSFPAGGPRGSWPAEEFAAEHGATVVMDLDTDELLVIADAVGVAR